MEISLDQSAGNTIKSYESGRVTIDEKTYTTSLVVTSEKILEWPPLSFNELTLEHLQLIKDFKPELVLIGSGERQKMLPAKFLAFFGTAGIGIECMTTSAACRTYNLLVSEARNVAVGLIL